MCNNLFMPDRPRKKRPRDLSLLARQIVEEATGEPLIEKSEPETQPKEDTRNPHAVALGRLGGLKGGKARAAKLTPEQRSAISRKAGKARWKKED
jgi:hypothetical protein